MNKNLKTILVSLGPQLLFCQNVIQLDRPDQTETPAIVPKNYLQFESGITFEKLNHSEINYQLPSVLWKYGLDDKTEIRLITEMSGQKYDSETKFELSPVTLGFKTSILEEKGMIPKTFFIGHLELFSKDSEDRNRVVPSFRFTFQNSLSESLSLGYNLGIAWNAELQETYLYTLTLGNSFNKNLGAYLEIYGFVNPFQLPDHRLDGGITYLINTDFMVDFSGGLGLVSASPPYFVSLGISHRINLGR